MPSRRTPLICRDLFWFYRYAYMHYTWAIMQGNTLSELFITQSKQSELFLIFPLYLPFSDFWFSSGFMYNALIPYCHDNIQCLLFTAFTVFAQNSYSMRTHTLDLTNSKHWKIFWLCTQRKLSENALGELLIERDFNVTGKVKIVVG